MQENNKTISPFETFENSIKRRRALLPWWIKFFCWLFMLFGLLAFVCLILGIIGFKTALSFYGFETTEPFSLNGVIVILVAIFKGFTAFSLWFEKDYAVKLGKIDALIGIVLCTISMFVLPFLQNNFGISIRLELALLIPYLIKLNKIQKEWETLVY